MPAYIGWPRGARLFTLVSESVVSIAKFIKMAKFLFLAQGHVWVKK